MDGTPILDIKPTFRPTTRSPASPAAGRTTSPSPIRTPIQVGFTALACTQAEWLREHWAVDFRPRLIELLGRDPSVQRTRRIRARGPTAASSAAVRGEGRLPRRRFSPWKSSASGTRISPRFLEDLRRLDVPDREGQQAFLKLWPEQTIGGEGGELVLGHSSLVIGIPLD